MPYFMKYYGLTSPPMPHVDLNANAFFDWLHRYLAMLEAGVQLFGDMSAVVAARTLATSVYRLFAEDGSSPLLS